MRVSYAKHAMGRVIAVTNQKGGVGKTTTAINLAASLAAAERRVLAVDADPQGNLTSGLGRKTRESRPGLYEALLEQRSLEELIIQTDLPLLSLVPSDRNLTGAEVELVPLLAREFRLKEALGPVAGRFDYVFIDCPPSLGLLTVNALVAADRILVPLQCEFYALEGLTQLLQTIRLVRERLNPRLAVAGIVLTMFDGRTSLALQIRDEVHRYFPGEIFNTVIPRNVRLSEAPSYGKPVMLHDLRSSGSVAYLELTEEVLKHE